MLADETSDNAPDEKKGEDEEPAVTALLAFAKLAGVDQDDDEHVDVDEEIRKIMHACHHPLIADATSADDLVARLNGV